MTKRVLAFCMMTLCSVWTLCTSTAIAQNSGSLQIITSKGPVDLNIEYAITPAEKSKGLMHRKSLPRNSGMLFIYQTPQPVTMWMKDTPLSLDMIFINNRGLIRSIEENTRPNSTFKIHSGGKVSAVLEVNAGVVKDLGIKVGDQIILK